MALYQEIYDLQRDNVLLPRIATAIGVAADTIVKELNTIPNHTNRVIWAKKAFSNPMAEARKFQMAVLSANAGLTVTAITGAGDAAIQNNVNAVIDTFADGS